MIRAPARSSVHGVVESLRRFEPPRATTGAVDREQAAEALEVLRRVVEQTRDDTVLQNWGIIWILHGALYCAGFLGTHVLFATGQREPPAFVMLWGAAIGLGLLTALTLRRERAGARTFVETQLWSIWLTFIAAVSLVAILNHAMGLQAFFLGPVIGVLAAVAFSAMGSLMGKRWYLGAGIFAIVAIAMARWPDWQFVILGVSWGLAQTGGGVLLHRARKRRLARGEPSPRLV
jgi:hypothetical protein